MTNKKPCVCHTCGETFSLYVGEINRKTKKGTKFYCSLSCGAKQPKQNPSAYSKSEENKTHLKSICGNRQDSLSPFRELTKRARMRKHECNITPEYLKELWEAQEGRCPFLKRELVLPLTSYKHDTSNPNLIASLDRIDNKAGYVEGNVRFISVTLNYARNKYDDSVLLNLMEMLREA